jgi:hypothetical protein
MWHYLYFLPEPQGQGSLRPVFNRACQSLSAINPPRVKVPPLYGFQYKKHPQGIENGLQNSWMNKENQESMGLVGKGSRYGISLKAWIG